MTGDLLLTLHAVRLLGFADTHAIADRFSRDHSLVESELIDAGVLGFVSRTSFAGSSGWALSNLGRVENERLLAAELEREDARPLVMVVHDEFVNLNLTVVSACSAIQLQQVVGTAAAGILEEALASWSPLEERLAGLLPRFAGYSRRLMDALEHARTDTAWFTATDRDSFHRAWFELHEDLIATLGIQRG
ncbi:hypothetical protein [Paenarthrobacter sp. 2TAF44]|uniref:hypothetical protein n=1 Tax=Paenarthrobacter sp. 2TAF44 TaxID=3233018 RepID=UPI003F9C4091